MLIVQIILGDGRTILKLTVKIKDFLEEIKLYVIVIK